MFFHVRSRSTPGGLPEDAQPQELQEVFDSVANVVEAPYLTGLQGME